MTNSQVQIGPKPIGSVQESDGDNVDEYLGYLTFSTTGEALVPREWLLEQWENERLPQNLFPKKPSDWSAYRRTMQVLLEESDYSTYEIWDDEYGQNFQCRLSLDKSNDRGSNVFICYADVFFPEETIGEEGGDWRDIRLGHFDFHSEDGSGGIITTTEIDTDSKHYENWENICNSAREVFNKMKVHHNFADFQKILKEFRSRSNAVEIRRAVYFVGAHHQETVESLSRVWENMNQFKTGGEEMRIETTPVVNLESQRELIAEKASEQIREAVDDIINEVFDSWDEDESAEKISRRLMNELGDSELDDATSEYNKLIGLKLSVKDILSEQLEDMNEEQEEVVEKILNQKSLSDV